MKGMNKMKNQESHTHIIIYLKQHWKFVNLNSFFFPIFLFSFKILEVDSRISEMREPEKKNHNHMQHDDDDDDGEEKNKHKK